MAIVRLISNNDENNIVIDFIDGPGALIRSLQIEQGVSEISHLKEMISQILIWVPMIMDLDGRC